MSKFTVTLTLGHWMTSRKSPFIKSLNPLYYYIFPHYEEQVSTSLEVRDDNWINGLGEDISAWNVEVEEIDR